MSGQSEPRPIPIDVLTAALAAFDWDDYGCDEMTHLGQERPDADVFRALAICAFGALDEAGFV